MPLGVIGDPARGEYCANGAPRSGPYPIGADGAVASEPDHSTLMITGGWTDRIGVPSHG